MIKLNNHDYKIIFLDTNAIREISSNKQTETGFIRQFIGGQSVYVPCYSMYNIVELKPYTDLYTNFMKLFMMIPSFLFYPFQTVFHEEWEAAQKGVTLEINGNFVNAFSQLNPNPIYHLDTFMEMLWNDESYKGIRDAVEGLQSVAHEWEKARQIDFGISNTIKAYRSLEFYGVFSLLRSSGLPVTEDTDISKFPGARLMAFSQFNRTHSEKTISKNDVMDVKISCALPYVDAVITENYQAEVLKKAKGFIPQISGLEIYRLGDLQKQWRRDNDK